MPYIDTNNGLVHRIETKRNCLLSALMMVVLKTDIRESVFIRPIGIEHLFMNSANLKMLSALEEIR